MYLVVYEERFGVEYIIVQNERKTWPAAQEDCMNRGDGFNLASITSDEELHFLAEHA